MSREIFIAGRRYVVPDDFDPREIRQLANVDRERFLAIQNTEGEGYEILDEKKQLPEKRELNFISLPRYRQGFDYRRVRIEREAENMSIRFVVEVDYENLNYILIRDFPLNKNWSQPTTPLLLKIPKDYPQTPPSHFFMRRSLTYKGGNPSHYFKEIGLNELANNGWGKYCLHVEGSWRPSDSILDDDSLLTYIELIKTVLDNLEREEV